jgi:hypothetical protein
MFFYNKDGQIHLVGKPSFQPRKLVGIFSISEFAYVTYQKEHTGMKEVRYIHFSFPRFSFNKKSTWHHALDLTKANA